MCSDPAKLKYKLTNIQIEYEMIRSKTPGDEAHSVYSSGKEFAYNQMTRAKVDAQRRSLKAILLLFIELYTAGTRDSKKYVIPDLQKVSLAINGSPNILYNNGIKGNDMWEEAHCFFVKDKNKTEHMDLKKFYTSDKFGLLIDVRSIAGQTMHVHCEQYRRSPARDQAERQRLRHRELPHFRDIRLSVQHTGQTVTICAVLNGPRQHSLQCGHGGPDQLRQNTVPRKSSSAALSAAGLITSCSSAQPSLTTRTYSLFPRDTRIFNPSSASNTR